MNEQTTVAPNESWPAYRVVAAGCELRHPPDWTMVTGMLGALVAAIGPPRGADTFRSNLNVVLQAADGELSQEECVAAQLLALDAALDDAVVLESEAVPLGGRPGARALAAYQDGDLELTLEQWILPVPSGALVLSATALTPDFPHDASAFRAIADSLTFDD
jgi:hypothetical protein